jgi:hypothetical protein
MMREDEAAAATSNSVILSGHQFCHPERLLAKDLTKRLNQQGRKKDRREDGGRITNE